MSDPVVHVNELTKIFKVPEREPGLRAAAKSLVRRKTREVHAVEAISFDIEPGEVVGFLGPNGAGQDDDAEDARRACCTRRAARRACSGTSRRGARRTTCAG